MRSSSAPDHREGHSEESYPGCIPCRPFVKWAGGKSQIVSELERRLPKKFSRYFEPFVGGGALFFSLQPPQAHLIDVNDELINAYVVVRDHVEDLIVELSSYVYRKDYFYQVRDADRTSSYMTWPPIKRAGRFIYLNKTCYNGLYRVNAKGHFNTPFGRYTNPTIVDPENMRACSKALHTVCIEKAHFETIEDHLTAGDFVYLDPPYMPLTATANFTGYASGGFSADMQHRLFRLCCRLDTRGVQFMLSNSASPLITMLYQQFRVEYIRAARAINSRASRRGAVEEVIIRNY